MRSDILYFMLIPFILLTGCLPDMPVNQTQVSTISESRIQTPTIIIPPTVSITPAATSLNSADRCIGSIQDLSEDLDGQVVLSGQNLLIPATGLGLSEVPSYILNFETGENMILPQMRGDEIKDFSVSPNKKWLAYFAQQPETEGDVYIVGNDGVLFNKYPAGDWWGILNWLDNERLLVSKAAQHNPYSSLIFNPFTGETEQELSPNYPEIFSGYSGELSTWGRYQFPETVYNPDLSMVVYPKSPTTIVLWNVSVGEEITKIVDQSSSSRAPLWLLNGEEFVVDITATNDPDHWYQDELVGITADGAIRQFTHLADMSYKNVSILNYSESVDGRYLAFWFAQVNSGPSRLAVYNTVTAKTTVFCTIVGGYVPPVWSPSENQMLVDGTLDRLENYGTVFIDVEKGSMAQVEKGVIPAGWMISR